MNVYRIINSSEFDRWLLFQTEKSRVQVNRRLSKIKSEGHFGDTKQINAELRELRWKNGRRVYYAPAEDKIIILLSGGNKNGQSQDIRKAQNIFDQWKNSG